MTFNHNRDNEIRLIDGVSHKCAAVTCSAGNDERLCIPLQWHLKELPESPGRHQAIPENREMKKHEILFSIKDKYGRQVLIFLLWPIEWQTFHQNSSTSYYFLWKKLNFHFLNSPIFGYCSATKHIQLYGWPSFSLWPGFLVFHTAMFHSCLFLSRASLLSEVVFCQYLWNLRSLTYHKGATVSFRPAEQWRQFAVFPWTLEI